MYRSQIIDLIEPVIESEHMELVHVECLKGKNRWLVRIYIDKEGGVTVDDCAEISNQVGDLLEVHDIPPGPYTLEVSSPGPDRPIARDRDFIKFRGCTVKIKVSEKMAGRRNFTGTLIDYLEKEGKKTLILDIEGTTYQIPREMVVKANLQYEF
jgi:ribosome maturation factor RimP